MPTLSMLNPFAFSGAEISSDQQKQETLAELFSLTPHLAATAGMMLAAISAAMAGAEWSAVIALATVLISLAVRAALQWHYIRRDADLLQKVWAYRFVAGSLFSCASYGTAGSVLLMGATQGTQLLVVAVACAIAQGVAARAYMMPGTAVFNLLLILGPISAAAFLDGTYLMVPAAVIYLGFLISFIVMMVKLRLRQLKAERLSETLLEQILEKNSELENANARLAVLATTDSLTGLANRRQLDDRLASSLRLAAENRMPLSLLLIDVDHFKLFNDTYGHQTGDACLKKVAAALASCNWVEGSLVARYGGEEFAVLMPGAGSTEALRAAEQARVAVKLMDISSLAGSPPRQTISIGALSLEPNEKTTTDELLRRADRALYQAKQNGRNRVSASEEARDTDLSTSDHAAGLG
ncbi:MAG: GGDEF domain-containing protein [Alphaproteobacteria bacterium]|nr:GGDEF domain-containing protein [Alphaproteobacteria bacterium]